MTEVIEQSFLSSVPSVAQTAPAMLRNAVQPPSSITESAPRFELMQNDADYPELLLLHEDSPKVIYGLGQESALQTGVAIIGARNATPYGIGIAKRVAGWAADLGLVVYSGGARGCDQAAHRGALEAGGSTVAVMGCGADIVYPSRSDKLFQEIVRKGAVISKYGWQTPPMKYRFVERNRLIAALSDLVIVVEARLPSGTLSTVHHALDLGVPVAAVPGSILCLESAAPNRLISEGAFPICCRDDLAVACNLLGARPSIARLYEDFESAKGRRSGKERRVNGKMQGDTRKNLSVQNGSMQTSFDFEGEAGNGTEQEAESHASKILLALSSMPSAPDELAQDLDLSLGEVLEVLGHFEIQGHVIRYPDGRYGSSDDKFKKGREVLC